MLIFSIGWNTCICAPPMNWKKATPIEFEYSKNVFIGEVTVCDDENYEMVICEVFKGELTAGQMITGKNRGTCGPYVDKNGEWIMFGEYTTEFTVNDCGISMSMTDPRMLPPPPPSNADRQEQKFIATWKAESKKNRQEQLKILRKISVKNGSGN